MPMASEVFTSFTQERFEGHFLTRDPVPEDPKILPQPVSRRLPSRGIYQLCRTITGVISSAPRIVRIVKELADENHQTNNLRTLSGHWASVVSTS
jgi:hypothetical protein